MDSLVAVVDMSQPDAAANFVRSLKETGFAVVENHGIDDEKIQGCYAEWKGFMMRLHDAKCADADAEEKALLEKYLFSKADQDGYFGMDVSEVAKNHNVKDIKHYYQCYFPKGRYPKEVSETAKTLHEEFLMLARTLLGWIQDGTEAKLNYNLPDVLSAEDTMLRILHYPAYDDSAVEPGAVRAAAHEDINFITLLPAGTAKGLQLKLKGEWHEVPLVRGSLIVNIGDMLQEATNFEYKSTTHRVVKPENQNPQDSDSAPKDRMSMPCFIHPQPNTYLSERHPTAAQFLDERLRQLGVK
eukprot:TRINITY_DN21731_c0_g1_i1.p1 TRINITY_DN21731_c0_g1~~TRINITY_DN21731_c0_g1_i1.p1  ORF type:complete len:299 (-),score=67.03 TRINITY_DN21731_c0_g1_i1:261-1157(-)